MTVLILLVAILIVTIGILVAIKKGFNEVIKGLEALDQELVQRRPSRPEPPAK